MGHRIFDTGDRFKICPPVRDQPSLSGQILSRSLTVPAPARPPLDDPSIAIPSPAIRGKIERPQSSQWRQSQMGTTRIVDREPSGEHGAADIARQRQIAANALKEALRLGASSAEVAISSSAGLSVNVRMGEVETIEHTRDKALGISVYIGHKKGSASTTDFSSRPPTS